MLYTCASFADLNSDHSNAAVIKTVYMFMYVTNYHHGTPIHVLTIQKRWQMLHEKHKYITLKLHIGIYGMHICGYNGHIEP